jgi:hypothetical protein
MVVEAEPAPGAGGLVAGVLGLVVGSEGEFVGPVGSVVGDGAVDPVPERTDPEWWF